MTTNTGYFHDSTHSDTGQVDFVLLTNVSKSITWQKEDEVYMAVQTQ